MIEIGETIDIIVDLPGTFAAAGIKRPSTCVQAFPNLAAFHGEAQFLTWLTRIAHNEALGRLRRRRHTSELDAIDMATNSRNGEAEMAREARRRLECAVDDLPVRQAFELTARRFHPWSIGSRHP